VNVTKWLISFSFFFCQLFCQLFLGCRTRGLQGKLLAHKYINYIRTSSNRMHADAWLRYLVGILLLNDCNPDCKGRDDAGIYLELTGHILKLYSIHIRACTAWYFKNIIFYKS